MFRSRCKTEDILSYIHLTTGTKRKRILDQGIESKPKQKNIFIRFSNLLHWSQSHKQHFHLLCPLSKAQLNSTSPFYSEACRLQVIWTIFSSSDTTEEGKWFLGHAIFNACLSAMPSLLCHFYRGWQLWNTFSGEDMKAILKKKKKDYVLTVKSIKL